MRSPRQNGDGARFISCAVEVLHLFGAVPMTTRSDTVRGVLLASSIVVLLAAPGADAHGHGGGGGHSAGRAARAPHFSSGARAYKAPRMSHTATPARVNSGRSRSRGNNTHSHTNSASALSNNSSGLNNNHQSTGNHTNSLVNNNSAQTNLTPSAGTKRANVNGFSPGMNVATAGGTTRTNANGFSPSTNLTGAASTTPANSTGLSPNTFTYGYGSGARPYRAYGYGNGYRNRGYRGGYGYGRSQGNNRAVIARLRSVHASLARIDHDYQGHRVRAMHAISMAIRQLSHRSMVYSGVGFSGGMNNGLAMGRRQGGAGARRGQPMSQAQSDARMSQDLRILQGINMQLSAQGNTSGHARASGHVQRAIHELNIALSIR